MTRSDHRVIIAQPLTSLAEECASSTNETSGCAPKWDTFLCWPQSEVERMVAIPCNASDPFVQIVRETRPDISHIPGADYLYCYVENVILLLTYSLFFGLGLAYQYCQPNGLWANKTNYDECTIFLVSSNTF